MEAGRLVGSEVKIIDLEFSASNLFGIWNQEFGI